jgi:HlyD family secretion protein
MLVVIVLALLGYMRFLSPVRAQSHRVERGSVQVEVFGRGTIESQREAQLGFDLSGRLSAVSVEEGAHVVLGQDLARLSIDQVQADFRAALTSVTAARSSLTRIAADERRAQIALDAAEREEGRSRALLASGAITQHQLDVAVDQLRTARAELDRILAQRAEATRSIEVAAGGAEQKKVTVMRATLLAPFDGLVVRRMRDPGDSVTTGTTVLRLVDTEHVHVSAWIDETVVTRIKEGQVAQILFPGDSAPLAASVSKVGWESDRQTHELLVEVTPPSLLRRVSIGQRADVWITTDRKDDVLRIPNGFVRRDDGGTSCFVDRGGRVATVRIKLGLVGKDVVEVTEGLREGDVVLAPLAAGAPLPERRKWLRP